MGCIILPECSKETGGNLIVFYEFYEQIVDIIPRITRHRDIGTNSDFVLLVVGLVVHMQAAILSLSRKGK